MESSNNEYILELSSKETHTLDSMNITYNNADLG